MKLSKARVTDYRSVKDSGWIDFEQSKTIMVGPNEAGKSAILRALQQINAPIGTTKFDVLRDYPRKDYNDITTKKADPATTDVVVAHFTLEDRDKALIDEDFRQATYVFTRRLDNSSIHNFEGGPDRPATQDIAKDLQRLAAHIDSRQTDNEEKSSVLLEAALAKWSDGNYFIQGDVATAVSTWLTKHLPLVDEANETEEARYDKLLKLTKFAARREKALNTLHKAIPVFVLFSNYYRVRPLIHLDHLATRIEQKLLDDDQYDYGNECLLKLLGFTARELSTLGRAPEPGAKDHDALKTYRDQLDQRSYQLNAASVRLTSEIVNIWNPNPERAEANRLRITADGQYLKVVVEDELGVEIELDQRSEGFQWLVSFFVVFFSETAGKHSNAILLLDEPGMSLHALKQRDFRETISKLAEANQTVYTTHSPFLVGPNELDLVRVIEMKDRRTGTKVHTTVTAADPAALLPLQEALGYDLAQSLFAQQRNLILEGLTDFWYVEATAELLRQDGIVDLNSKIALVPANTASKVVYFATILVAHNLKVAALLDSDNAGDQAAKQDVLVHRLGAKRILRTMDFTVPPIPKAEIEDILRDTLIKVASSDLGIDVSAEVAASPTTPVIDLLTRKGGAKFSKYKLAKAYVRWTREHSSSDLSEAERKSWSKLIDAVNAALK
ncbi:AAA family ATPase [Agrobacterium rosae]|uniref:Putative ATP-binding protein involved in virulence n=1 Tax=Agrobacterium rosae TaxID=1972867 RepID=A0A1R3TEW2_9HYPH|nr:AAA family ATPase [Agrobacterium rosae]SCX03891.1 putative ATP-binding protein involved in virulence [Agrobacterium rosae]